VGDRLFASEGDSVDVGRRSPAARADRWDDGDPHRAPADDASIGVVRRLQGRLDRHLWLLDRLRSDPLGPEPHGLPELLETARRMRRDTESLLLLGGQDPGVPTGAPRRLSDVLGDAASAAEEPRRVDVRSAPAATVTRTASVEFLHVLAELVDHVTAVHPGARVEIAARVEPSGGVTVDVSVDGAGRHDPEGPGGTRAAAAAEQLAQRSRSGIDLLRPPAGPPPTGSGLVASVHCPAAAVTVEEPGRPHVAVADPPGPRGNGTVNGNSNGNGNGNGAGHPANGAERRATASMLSGASAPAYAPSASSQVDELFGPLLDLPLETFDDRYSTPIFEAIASAWFREGDQGAAPSDGQRNGADVLDWESPHDGEWRAAAARAARPDPLPATSSGLPRRRPGNQLVPPPRTTGPDPAAGPAERVPDRVRDRLSTYQRGLRQGRHRAPGPEGTDAETW
jgi:hypothetical protein